MNQWPVREIWSGEDPSTDVPVEVDYWFIPGESPHTGPGPGLDDDYPGSPDEVQINTVFPSLDCHPDYDEDRLVQCILEARS